jgi:hypothetical protein
MFRGLKILACAALALSLMLTACGGDDDDDGGDDENTPAASATSDGTEPAGGSTPSGSTTPSSTGSGEPISEPPAESDRVWTLEEAQALLDTLPLMPADLESNWTIMADTTADNAAAAAAGDMGAASFERCGRLLSRLVVNSPVQEDLVTRYIGGETVSFFSTATVYATDAGAADCAAESVARLVEGGCPAIAALFGSIFIDPNAVSCVPFEFPQVGNGSTGLGLSGQISAAGQIVNLTIRVVSWRYGNITAVVGSAAASDPLVEELVPLVELVDSRLQATRE